MWDIVSNYEVIMYEMNIWCFQINLPTGGQIIVKPQGQFINVMMKGSPLDIENVEGKDTSIPWFLAAL